VRGCVFAPSGDVAYPRLSPADADQVPGDVWAAAAVPVMVRLEMIGDAPEVLVRYLTTTGDLGYRGDAAGCSFIVHRSGHTVAEVPAELGEGEVVLPLAGDPAQPAIVYLPEGMRPVILDIRPLSGRVQPAPRQPRCIVVGDAAAQGWLASSPASSWPAIVGRKVGVDIADMACAGTVRLEPVVASQVAAMPAEAVVVSVGPGCWHRPPRTAAAMAEEVRAFVQIVRAGHPGMPVVVVSPTVRPLAEDTPNLLGATLAELRRAVEDVVAGGTDEDVLLVPGEALLGPEDLADGMYPADEGHRRIAAAVARVLGPRASTLRAAAVARWQEELLASTPAFSMGTSPSGSSATTEAAASAASPALSTSAARPPTSDAGGSTVEMTDAAVAGGAGAGGVVAGGAGAGRVETGGSRAAVTDERHREPKGTVNGEATGDGRGTMTTAPAVAVGTGIGPEPGVGSRSPVGPGPAVGPGLAVVSGPAVVSGSAVVSRPAVVSGPAVGPAPAVVSGSAVGPVLELGDPDGSGPPGHLTSAMGNGTPAVGVAAGAAGGH
jgi:hypothetical protein